MDDKTAKRVERDWIAGQSANKLMDPTEKGVPQGFVRFAWIWCNETANYWWVFPFSLVGMLAFSLSAFYILSSIFDSESLVVRIGVAVASLTGIGVGFAVGTVSHVRRHRAKSKEELRDE